MFFNKIECISITKKTVFPWFLKYFLNTILHQKTMVFWFLVLILTKLKMSSNGYKSTRIIKPDISQKAIKQNN